jgi:hypothetical protein
MTLEQMKELAVILEDALRNKVEEDGVMHDAHYQASEALHKAMSLRSAIGTVLRTEAKARTQA